MSALFGTDGIRGTANADLTPEIALALGECAARHLDGAPFLIGRDTRRSGPMLAAAFAAGVAAAGVDVIDLGVLPTPGVAHIAERRGVPAAVVSASHNPFPDNGVKLLSRGGQKLAESAERAIEADLQHLLGGGSLAARPTGAGVGHLEVDDSGAAEYLEALACSVDLHGRRFKLVVDCANGASSAIAPLLFERLGQDATVLFSEPDGSNINADCGSTHPEHAAEMVRSTGADLGLCFDGDADRLIALDENGEIVDGDQLIALFAYDLDARGALDHRQVAITVMSNLGLRRALESHGIGFIETAVGDRNVLDAMDAASLVLGGEQSGHIVFALEATTGDGMRTSLKLLEVLSKSENSLSELANGAMTRFPQVLRNVPVPDPRDLLGAEAVWAEVKVMEVRAGRVLVRASGTEPAVRVMVEAEHLETAESVAEHLAAIVRRELGTTEAGS